VQFCVVGGGSEEGALRRMIRSRGLESSFVLAGERRSASDLLPAFDVFVMTSRFEGLPNGLMEAMAAGLPSVCTAVGGCGEIVEEARTGFLVPPDDTEAMARGLRQLVCDADLRARMGEAARKAILTGYSVERLAAETDQIFRGLINSAGSAPRGRRLAAALRVKDEVMNMIEIRTPRGTGKEV
jgi:glycosyltransferase involved in cell wall biosynthesis